MVEIEYMIVQKDEDQRRVDNLIGYARRIHRGLIPNAARRNPEDMRSTRGEHHCHPVMQGGHPMEGPGKI